MKLARYVGDGKVEIVDEPVPACPPGGLLVKTEACGLCSGELMSWYMDQKIPHVLGHEVSGVVVESQDERYPVGSKVFPHHHAACMECALCLAGLQVHCGRWRNTKLIPGGMAEFFAVPRKNLTDTLHVEDMRPVDAALIEPLACVMKSLRLGGWDPDRARANGEWGFQVNVIGLGVMGLMHMLTLDSEATGCDLNPSRVEWARGLGLRAGVLDNWVTVADLIIVCPGSQQAFNTAVAMARPGATIVMFAPLAPSQELTLPQALYFKDIKVVQSYSCGPDDTRAAADAIRAGKLRAEQVVSDFIGIDELPEAYGRMKTGEILKPMVVFE